MGVLRKFKDTQFGEPSIDKIRGVRKMMELPAKLDFYQLEEKHPLEGASCFKHERNPKGYKLKLLVDLLYRNMDDDPNSEYYLTSSVHSDILRKIIPNYQEYKRYLLEVKVLKTEDSYRVNHYSKLYYLSPTYFEKTNTTKEIMPYEIVERMEREADRKLLTKEYVESKGYLFAGFFNGLHLDEKAALEKANELCFQGDGFNQSLFNKYKGQIKAFKKVDGRFSVSDKVSRLSTPLTNLKSDFRQFLSYRGERLLSLDIKNSQPYFINLLLEEEKITEIARKFPKSQERGEGEGEERKKRRKKERERTIMSLHSIQPILRQIQIPQFELQNFFRLSSSGSIYEDAHEFNASVWGEEYPYHVWIFDEEKDRQITLDEACPLIKYKDIHQRGRACSKKLFVRYIGGRSQGSDLQAYFMARFPSIHKFICKLKEEDTTMFSRVLQLLEAHFVLDLISGEFCHENPEARVFTIHDSIATQERFIEVLQAKTKEVFTRYLPKPPQMHIEPWCDECFLEGIAA